MDIYKASELGVMKLFTEQTRQSLRTMETGVREVMFSGEQMSKGFRPEELPAMMVSAELEAKRSRPETFAEIAHDITVQVLIVTKAQKRDDARSELLGLLDLAEQDLNLGRRTNEALGWNTFITDDILTSLVQVYDQPFHYAVGNITVTVRKVVDL